MLVLSRKLNERIVLPTIGTAVQVLGIKQGVVRLGIDAPPEVTVLRAELLDRSAEGEPAQPRPESRFTRQLHDRLTCTGAGLGLLRLQLDTGLTEDARTTLAALQQDFQMLLHGVAGETEAPVRDKGTSSVSAAEKKSVPLSSSSRGPKRQRALLVEDDRNEREILAFFLRQSGLDVDTAGDGSDALDYLRCHSKPDVVLLDMGLPRVDGPTMVREVRSNPAYAGLKIFGVTAHLPEEFNLERGPAGVDRWFLKPFDPAVLIHDLCEELDGSICSV